MEGLAEVDVGNNFIQVVGADVHMPVELVQPEEERQLNSTQAKGQGKQNADFKSKLKS